MATLIPRTRSTTSLWRQRSRRRIWPCCRIRSPDNPDSGQPETGCYSKRLFVTTNHRHATRRLTITYDSIIQTPKRSKLAEPNDDAAVSSPIIRRSSQSLNASSLRLELDDSRAAGDSPVISKAGAAKSGSLTSALFDSMGLESDADDEEVDEEIMKVMESGHNDDDKDPGTYIFHNYKFTLYWELVNSEITITI